MPLSQKIFIILFACSLTFTILLSLSSAESKQERLINVINLHTERILTQIEIAVHVTNVLEEITKASNGNLARQGFDALAHAVGDGVEYIAIQFMPDGIVKYAYPLDGNEATIGHNVLEAESTAIESHKAMTNNEFVLSGPFNLIQGRRGLAIRNPVYMESEEGSVFWGFIAIVLPVPEILNDTGVFELEKLGYQYRLTAKYKGEDIIFKETENYDEDFAISMPIIIGDNDWTLSMYVKGERATLVFNALLMWAAFVLLSYIVFYIIKTLEYKLENDPLTGAYNRRFLEKYIKSKDIARGKVFALLYLDLNDFKPVNDNYGHEAGDRLLIAYVKRVQSNIKGDGLIFRIGGDEFVIIVPSVENGDMLQSMVSRIATFSKNRFMINGESITISTSIGVASFPKEGTDIKTLLGVADERMYADKQKHKATR